MFKPSRNHPHAYVHKGKQLLLTLASVYQTIFVKLEENKTQGKYGNNIEKQILLLPISSIMRIKLNAVSSTFQFYFCVLLQISSPPKKIIHLAELLFLQMENVKTVLVFQFIFTIYLKLIKYQHMSSESSSPQTKNKLTSQSLSKERPDEPIT